MRTDAQKLSSPYNLFKVRIRGVASVDSGLWRESRNKKDSIEMEVDRLNGHEETV